MIPIDQFLNKIKFSGKFDSENIAIYYLDRIQNKLLSVKYKDIKIEDKFLITENKSIPLHRIKEIRDKNIIVWQRKWERNTK